MKNMPVPEARALLMEAAGALKSITVPIDKAFGYTLSEPIATQYPIPHFDKSPYDGFAFACPAEGAKGHRFTVIGRIGAGEEAPRPLKEGEALRIMTGAPIPEGADTVAMFEQSFVPENPSKGANNGSKGGQEQFPYTIEVRGLVQPGDNIIKKGEECDAGTTVMEAGTLITAGTMALLTSLGHREIKVYRKPSVAVLTSGKELIPLNEELTDSTIYNSNGPMLISLLQEEGIEPVLYHHVTDDPHEIDEEIAYLKNALANVDVVISTGGVSVGDFDFMPHIYETLRAKTFYRRVAMRPGAAQYGGASERTIFVGLSGNPSAAFNGFHLIAAPLLRKLKGETQWTNLPVRCILEKGIAKHNPFDRYIQGAIKLIDDTPYFCPVEVFTSNAVIGLAMADGLYKMPQGKKEIEAGEPVDVLLLQKRGTK